MAQVFSNSGMTTPIDVWDMQGAIINFGGMTGLPNPDRDTDFVGNSIVALGLELSFQRGITKRYPINIKRIIYIAGTPDGSIRMSCLFGPTQNMVSFLRQFGAIADYDSEVVQTAGAGSITIRPFGSVHKQGASKKELVSSGTWTILNPMVVGVGLTIQEGQAANAIQALGNVSMTFDNLDIHDENDSGEEPVVYQRESSGAVSAVS